jgi:hypothetical protein
MALTPSIILAGQSPDIVNALANSNVAAQQRLEFDRTTAMNRMLQEQGAGIISGDQNALNALAGYSPEMAMGIQESRLGMDATRLGMDQTRQQMSISAERLAMEKAEGKRMAEAALSAQAAQMTAAQLAAEQKQITDALSGAASFYQKGDRAGYDAWLGKLGLDPREYAFDEFPAHAAMFEGVLEAMQTFAPPTINPNDRFKVAGGTIFDLGAEGGPKPVGQGAMQETMVLGPDGKPIMVQGGPGTTAKFTESQSKDNVYATRAEGALSRLEPVADALTSRAGVVGEAASGLTLGLSREMMQSDEFQLARQAGDEFLQAILRKDTGAAITADEQELYGKTYLPQVGDSPAVLAQKKVSRAGALEAIRAGMSQAQIEAVARADAATIARLAQETGAAAPASPAAPEAATPPKRLKFNPETGELE